MARYIAEHSLQEYQFVSVRPSQMAAASMYLALRMKKLGGWVYMCKFSQRDPPYIDCACV